MHSVRFRGWHGPDSRATYEPISLFPDDSNCSCKKGHSAKDIPIVSLFVLILWGFHIDTTQPSSTIELPVTPPPVPLSPDVSVSPPSPPPSTVKRRTRSLQRLPSPPPSPTLPPSPERVSSFGRTIKKSRVLRESAPEVVSTKVRKARSKRSLSDAVSASPENPFVKENCSSISRYNQRRRRSWYTNFTL